MIRKIIRINSVLIVLLMVFFFIYPPVRAVLNILDPALRQPGIPKAAWRLYRNLTPRYAAWAEERVQHGGGEGLSLNDISGTEWPLFGSVFYLWGIENLQAAWEAGDHTTGVEPRVFARDAIIAASELVIDPRHATWVKQHWGADYLHKQNAFYRMMVIAALTSREKLLHDGAHLDTLRDQVETFSQELDASKTGLLDDYPAQCYPGDIMAALMCIKRADAVLGTDHSAFLKRALRGFIGTKATRYQLPPYAASSVTGLPISGARGCANSYFCLAAPELWPGQARQWYDLYDRFFWQQRFTAAGYREYPNDLPNSNWSFDVDAGPVVAGYGVAACSFGIGAARKNGRFDRAYPLAAEMLATVWELPNGVLAVPRLLSNFSDAPMLGEVAILCQLTIQPEKGFALKPAGAVPAYVYLVLAVMFLFGAWRIMESILTFKEARRPPDPPVWLPRFQVTAWAAFSLAALATSCTGHAIIGTILLVIAVMLPILKRKKPPQGTEDWPDAQPPSPAKA